MYDGNKIEKKKMNKFLKFIIILLSILVVLFIIVIIIFPNLFWQKDLGVKTTQEAYDSILNKLQYIGDTFPSFNGDELNLTYENVNKINTIFTSEELTSFANITQSNSENIKNIQILLNDDNSISMSASVNKDILLETLNISTTDIPNLSVLDNVNISGKIGAEFKENKIVDFNIETIEVYGYDITNYLEENDGLGLLEKELNTGLDYLSDTIGIYIKDANIENGNMKFDGTFPSNIKTKE